jgi:nicotinate dehydrogenase subunit B
MAHYLASFSSQIPMLAEQEMAQILTNRAETGAVPHVERTHPAGARLFEGACASCHESDAVSSPALPSLALHTNLHSANPGNLVRAVLDGLNVPALGHFGAMPAFRASLDDRQIADLAGYLRARFAGDKPAWDRAAVTEAAARLRRGSPPG